MCSQETAYSLILRLSVVQSVLSGQSNAGIRPHLARIVQLHSPRGVNVHRKLTRASLRANLNVPPKLHLDLDRFIRFCRIRWFERMLNWRIVMYRSFVAGNDGKSERSAADSSQYRQQRNVRRTQA